MRSVGESRFHGTGVVVIIAVRKPNAWRHFVAQQSVGLTLVNARVRLDR
jgi:hypothetical protein